MSKVAERTNAVQPGTIQIGDHVRLVDSPKMQIHRAAGQIGKVIYICTGPARTTQRKAVRADRRRIYTIEMQPNDRNPNVHSIIITIVDVAAIEGTRTCRCNERLLGQASALLTASDYYNLLHSGVCWRARKENAATSGGKGDGPEMIARRAQEDRLMVEADLAEGESVETDGTMVVRMSASVNPDLPRHAGEGPLPPPVSVFVSSLRDAAKACVKYIETFGLGGGEFNHGWVLDAKSGRPLARVSYNGRLWTPEPDWKQMREIVIA